MCVGDAGEGVGRATPSHAKGLFLAVCALMTPVMAECTI